MILLERRYYGCEKVWAVRIPCDRLSLMDYDSHHAILTVQSNGVCVVIAEDGIRSFVKVY